MAGDFDRVKEEIRRRVDIVDLVSQRVSLKKTGRNFSGLCPFHDDKNPSFHVNSQVGSYKCWSCGARGDVFTWVMETQKVDFVDALKILAKMAGVDLPTFTGSKDKSESEQFELAMAEAQSFFREQLRNDKSTQDYVAQRGLDKPVLDKWELGYGPSAGEALAMRLKKKGFNLSQCQKLFLVDQDQSGGYYDRFRGRLIFPIFDERGKLVAFGGRIIGQGQPKYINSSDTPLYSKSRVLYGMNHAKETISRLDQAVLVEGYMDVIACHKAGVTHAVASLGTALAEDHVKLLKRWCNNVVILYDGDEAGIKAADRAAILLSEGGLKVKIGLSPAGEDPDTILKQKGAQAVQQVVEESVTAMEFRMESLEKRLKPTDDAFWPEVINVLATAETPLELEKYLHKIAPKYPGINDVIRAKSALARMVTDARRKNKQQTKAHQTTNSIEGEEKKVMPNAALNLKDLLGAERIIFQSLFATNLIEKAWPFARHQPLMSSRVGQRLAIALESFNSLAPKDDQWIHEVSDESAQAAFVELALLDSGPLTVALLEEAVDRLSRDFEAREIRKHATKAAESGMDDDSLRAINDRLKKLKGEKN